MFIYSSIVPHETQSRVGELLDVDEFFRFQGLLMRKELTTVQKCCDKSCGSRHFREFMYFPDCGLKGEMGKMRTLLPSLYLTRTSS